MNNIIHLAEAETDAEAEIYAEAETHEHSNSFIIYRNIYILNIFYYM